MNHIILNIGLDTNRGGKLNPFEVNDLIKKYFKAENYKADIKQSDTELTLIADFKTSKLEIQVKIYIEIFADFFEQDAIAIKLNGNGMLIYSENPLNDWGDFNQDYFIEL